MPRTALTLAAAALAASLGIGAPARATSPPPDWEQVADEGTIQIRTTDEKGTVRERTIWLAVVDGRGYVRAGGSSSWDSNVDAAPEVQVQIRDVWYDLLATRVPEGEEYDAVVAGMREKYGLSDALIGLFRNLGGTPRVLRLDALPGLPMGP